MDCYTRLTSEDQATWKLCMNVTWTHAGWEGDISLWQCTACGRMIRDDPTHSNTLSIYGPHEKPEGEEWVNTHIEAIAPEWWQGNTIEVTSFTYAGSTYTISTVRLSESPMPFFTSVVTALGDALNGNEDDTDKNYETMLFIDGESQGFYPFGDLPGNEMQGIYQRYWTEEEAKKGHQEFVERVKQVLAKEEVTPTTK